MLTIIYLQSNFRPFFTPSTAPTSDAGKFLHGQVINRGLSSSLTWGILDLFHGRPIKLRFSTPNDSHKKHNHWHSRLMLVTSIPVGYLFPYPWDLVHSWSRRCVTDRVMIRIACAMEMHSFWHGYIWHNGRSKRFWKFRWMMAFVCGRGNLYTKSSNVQLR